MADYYSDKVNSSGNAIGEIHIGPNLGIATVSVTAALSASDTIHLLRLFPGYSLVQLGLYFTDLDSNGTPTLTMSIGTEATTNLFSGVNSWGQAAGHVLGDWNEAFYNYPVVTEENLVLTVGTGAATGQAGTIHCWLLFNS